MTAVIWLVQVLIYPNFRFIPDSDFKDFHKRHCDRISLLVSPMIAQVFMVAMVLMEGARTPEWIFHATAIVLIHVATAVFSAPAHTKLGLGKDPRVIDRLILTNWIRTLLWSAELVWILARRMQT
jgi:hypothetical protein